MIKNIIEELILIALILVAVYFVYTKWLKGWLITGAAAADAVIKKEIVAAKTIVEAASNPLDTVNDLFKSLTTEYISQEQFRDNIAEIQAQLKGKQL